MKGFDMSESSASDSAISSWSGFVYQGKVALYHALKLITENKYNQQFEIQLDSTDDFAVYVDKLAISAHQIKAKASTYRSSYKVALSKSAAIEKDRTATTKRYFHVSVQLDDNSDYNDENGITVKFYSYDKESYCSLESIEDISKTLIETLLTSKKIEWSPKIIDYNYAILSESISRKVIEIHSLNQNHGQTINQAAYDNRIPCDEILRLATNIPLENDKDYTIVKLRSTFSRTLENHILDNHDLYEEGELTRLRATFEHLYCLDNSDLEKLCHLIQPTESTPQIPERDIQAYSDLICDFLIEPVLTGIPHYMNSSNEFYIPTAIDLPNTKRTRTFTTSLIKAIEKNDKLPTLLYEYKNLIAATCESPFEVSLLPTTINTTPTDDPLVSVRTNMDSNIVRKLQVKIISKSEAERELNVK